MTTTIDTLPAAPTNLPMTAKCTCGKWDFIGLDNEGMRREIATHLEFSPVHGKARR